MATPKGLVLQLHKHWEIVEELTRISREWPAFDEQTILGIISKLHCAPDGEPDKAAEALRALCKSDVLQCLERTETLQVNPVVLEFVRSLTREHELGLSSVLKARVDGIKQAIMQTSEGVEPFNHELIRQGAARLSDLFRQIGLQLDVDRHAIMDLAEQAKSSDSAQPIQYRYRAVLEAYDQYVEPMNEMMDSGLSGTFYPYLEQAEKVLDKAVETMNIQGGLYSHQLQLRQVAYQAKELQRLGRIVAQQCASTLLPLREELREHNSLSAAVSYLLGQVRKRGLMRGLSSRKASEGLPVWRQERPRRATVGYEIRQLMAEALAYTPQLIAFPDEVTFDEYSLDAVDEDALKLHLSSSMPVENLLIWLQQHYGEHTDATLLRLYHELVREPSWKATHHRDSTKTDLQAVQVQYHPHRIEPL
ncbi:hypothetical protein KAT72_21605 [Aeromonas popoffii]|uniref:DUF3375 domain-containing protein n=1 Tax=Aeromonas popoffii TaxID=70856 RepID=A0ABS5GWK7_9GAMM|nr:hypothetical protein [Aeromonas popoffii]MBR7631515.1 hypothetical protein [Aeromonas popoffii]